MKQIILLSIAVLATIYAKSQVDVGGIVKRKAEQKAKEKIEQGVDKAFDKTEEEAKDAAKGGKKNKSKVDGSAQESGNDNSAKDGAAETSGAAQKASLKTYGKFDFIPGEKIIVEDNFNQVAVGDFPVEWNTNSGGEIVTMEGSNDKWLKISKEGVFMPDYITDVPENFTMQFDVMVNEDFSFYSSALDFTFISTQNRQKLGDYGRFSHPANALRISLHPTNAGNGGGTALIKNWDKEGAEIIKNDVTTSQFHAKKTNLVHVSIWRQKQRVRVYFNEEKVLDIPRAFDAAAKYNALVMCFGGAHQDQDKYLLSNIRLAVGAPDTRSKLITEGKLVTRGILFDSGSDRIKPESYGTLKDIATVLQENATVKVKIIGHTDSDGEDASNLELSKKRAAAVKEALSKEFGIDPSRMETDGKGESAPSDKNDSAAGKANNRRVEFVKM
jgi:OmpA-OmpF porin, OOP family